MLRETSFYSVWRDTIEQGSDAHERLVAPGEVGACARPCPVQRARALMKPVHWRWVSPIAREALRPKGCEHEMHMVGHQTVGPDLDRILAAALGEQITIERVVGGFEKNRLAVIATLGYMVRKSRSDDTAKACQTDIVRYSRSGAIGKVSP